MGAVKGVIRCYPEAVELDPHEKFDITYLQRLDESNSLRIKLIEISFPHYRAFLT